MYEGLITECRASYSKEKNFLKLESEKGFLEMQPAFNYSGLEAKNTDIILMYAPLSQQAKQMDAFALAIKNNQSTIVSGAMDKRDMKIITCIYEAIETGKKIII